MKKIYIIPLFLILFVNARLTAQNISISDVTHAPASSAVLDVYSTSKGLLVPRIALTATTDVTTITAPAVSLLIFNTSTTGDVIPGYYYWTGSAWVRIASGSGSETDPLVRAINGLIKSDGTTISAAVAGVDYVTPVGSAALLTDFPTLNQNTTGNAATVTTNANLTGEVNSVGNSTTVTNPAVIGKVLTGFISAPGIITAGDNILSAIQKLNGNIEAGANLTGMVTSVGGTTTVVTNANSTGDVTSVGNATTIAPNAVTVGKMQQISSNSLLGRSTASTGNLEVITVGSGLSLSGGTLSAPGGSGTVTSASVVTANGVSGTVATSTSTPAITLTLGDITPTSVASTGDVSGSTLSTAGTITSTVATGTAPLIVTSTTPVANLNIGGNAATATTAGSVTTNANLTGDVTSVGNTTTIAPNAVTFGKLQQISSNSLLGRSTASTGNPEVITVGSGLTLSGGTLTAAGNEGTVTSASIVSANGISGTVATATSTPAITLTLGDITPTSVVTTGAVSGTSLTTTGSITSTVATGTAPLVITSTTPVANLSIGGNATSADVASKASILFDNNTNGAVFPTWVQDGGNQHLNASNSLIFYPFTGVLFANSFATLNGLESQFLKADGSVDDKAYLTSETGVGSITGTANQINASSNTGTVTLSLPSTLTGLTSVTSTGFTGALTGNATSATTAATVTTNANLTGEVTSVGNASTVSNAAVIGKVLTGYTSGAGTVAATDNILQAIQKLNGNAYVHPSGDGNLHVPATSTTNNGKVLTAGATAGSLSWVTPTTGSVITTSVVTANGVSGTVATATTTPAITLTLGAITPTSVAATGNVSGSTLSTSGSITSTVATGTAPLVVTSTTPVANLSIGGNAATSDIASGVSVTFDNSHVGSVYLPWLLEGYTSNVNATSTLSFEPSTGVLMANGFNKSGGTANQFLKADGSVDANTYLTSSSGVSSITGTANQINASSSHNAVALSLPSTLTGLTSVTSTGFTGALTGNATSATTAATVTTNANLTGEVTSVGNAATVTNAAVIGKVLTGYTSGAGTVAATDNILQAIQKLNGNNATNANSTGDVTSVGNSTTIAPNAVTLGKMQQISTNSLLGRSTASTGNPEVITVGSGLTLSAGTLTAAGTGWALTGNSGTTPGTNFVGTSDNNDVVFKRNGVQSGLLNSALNNTSWGVSALNPATTGTGNVATGVSALTSNTSGTGNVAVGGFSLTGNTTGASNVATGYRALYTNTTGSDNIAIGNAALNLNTVGINNIASGTSSLSANTTGSGNVATGYQTLMNNTTGSSSVVNGFQALLNNTTGNFNIAVGSNALYSNVAGSNGVAIGDHSQFYANNTTTPWTNYNTSVGYLSLRGSSTAANNTGNYNTALGYLTLMNNSTGLYNVAIGNSALRDNSTGGYNIAMGSNSLVSNTTGSYNSAIGTSALLGNLTGDNNTAMGYVSLYSNTTGSFNSAMGFYSLFYNTTGIENSSFGNNSLRNNTTGSSNAAFGTGALYSNTTGIGNTALGYRAGYNDGTTTTPGTLTNATAIGYYSQVTANNSLVLGGTGPYAVSVGIGISAPIVSAVLDVTSTTQGTLLPRMTTLQKAAIVTPATGLIVYDNTLNQLQVYNGTAWGATAANVTSVSVATLNGVSGTVANPTTTPAITLTLGAITPTSVAATGAVSGTSLSTTGSITSTVATGTAPLIVSSTTPVANLSIGGNAATATTAGTVTTNANLTGEVTSVGNTTTVTNAAVTGKVLTGYVSGAGVLSATDNILQTIQKLNGNDATNANMTGMVTSVGNATTVVTNANLTGDVTSLGNTTTIAPNAVTIGKIQQISTNSLLGRSTAAIGNPEVITVGSGLTLSGGTLTAAGSGGTLTTASVVTANGVSGTVATATTTPAITLTLGAITPASVAATGAVSGTSLSTTGSITSTIATGTAPLIVSSTTPVANLSIGGNAATATTAGTVTTNANLTGEITSLGNATTVTNAAVVGKVLTGYTSGAGTITATDNILQAIQKLNGNNATNANMTGDVTSVGNTTSIAPNVITNADLNTMATATFKGRATAGTGNVEDLTKAQVLALLNVADGATNYVHPSGDGNLHVPATSTTNSGKVLTAGATAGALSWVTPSTGSVTTASVVTANGVSGTVATATTTPAITLTLGAITPASVAATGTVSGSNLSGTNTGDNAINSLYSSLVSNATHTGDVTGSTSLTVVKINGIALSGLTTGILKNTTATGVPSIAVAGTDYLAPNGSAALLTAFPTLNQSTTGTAANVTGIVAAANGGTGVTSVAAEQTRLGLGTNAYSSTGYLPLIGGTLTGNLNVNNGTTTGRIFIDGSQVGHRQYAFSNGITGISNSGFQLSDETAGTKLIYWDALGVTTLTGALTGASATFTGLTVSGLATATSFTGAGTGLTGAAAGLTAGNVTTNANLTGEVTSVGNATTVTNAAVTGKALTGYLSGAGVISATDNILQAIQKLNGNDATNANMTGMVTSVGNATTVVTNANLTGEVTSAGNATTVTNAAVIGKVLTGYTSGAGTVAATDNILQAIQKLNGNAYVHPSGDGNLHVPATSTTNNGKVLTAGATAGSLSWVTPSTGSVTTASVVTANGISGTVATATTTPAITLTLGAITPASVAATGAVSGTSLSTSGLITSTVSTGTAPLVVNSSTPVANLSIGGNAASATIASTISAGLDNTHVGSVYLAWLQDTGAANVFGSSNLSFFPSTGIIQANGFNKSGGTAIQFLKADGSVDANTYLTSSSGVSSITGTANQITASASTGTVTLSLPSTLTGLTSVNSTGFIGALTGNATTATTAATVTTNANLTGEVTSVGNAATVTNAAVIGKVLTGYISGAGTITATDNILQAIQKLNGNNATNANMTGMVTSVGNATTVVTNANLTGPIISTGNATSIASQTGTGSTFVMNTSPVLVTPNLGTPIALIGTNITGTANGLSIGGSSNRLAVLPINTWLMASLPQNYQNGITTSFVQGSDGWPSFGTVINAQGLTGGGSQLQIYTPYSPIYGGNNLKVRFGNYDTHNTGNDWTAWKTLVNAEDLGTNAYSSSAYLPLAGGIVTGTITSTVATGTAPLIVTSTTPVANLSIGGNAATATSLSNFSVASGINTDTKGTTGINYFISGTTNPYTDGALIQQAYQPAPTTWGSQIMQDYRTGRLAVRGLNNGVWTSWLGIIDAGNIASQSVNYAVTSTTATNSINDGITNDVATATSVYPVWVTANTGNLPSKVSSTTLTLVPSTGVLTAGGFVKSGGTSSQFLKADGSVDANSYSVVREVADEFSATAAQTAFTLTQTPSTNSKVKMYINGIRISNTAYSKIGTALTYIPANNGSYALLVSDRIQFDYYY